MTELAVPSAWSSTVTVIAVTWRRLVRGRTLWVAGAIAVLPVLLALFLQGRVRSSRELFEFLFTSEQVMLALLPAMFVASSIGEDIEDRTTTYLWSRPIPRWVVLVGKLGALMPVLVVLEVVNWYAAVSFATGAAPSVVSCVALGGGAVALALVASGIATLAPRHGMALTILYVLLFDLGIGALPLSLRYLSVTAQQRALIEAFGDHPAPDAESAAAAAIALAAIGAVWLAIGLFRIRRLEA